MTPGLAKSQDHDKIQRQFLKTICPFIGYFNNNAGHLRQTSQGGLFNNN